MIQGSPWLPCFEEKDMDLNIIYEDKSVIVVQKPQQVPSQADKTGDKDMITLLTEYLVTKQIKKPYVGIIQRLDRPVGGIMVFTKTKRDTSILSKQLEDKKIKKHYLAVVCGVPTQKHEKLVNLLWKNERLNMSKVVCKGTNNAKEAILEYDVLETINDEEFGELSLIRIDLQTGRHHQIRVQLSHAGFPVWGDTKYNQIFLKGKTWSQIALWAEDLSFDHPFTGERCHYKLKPKEYPFSSFEF